MARPGRPNKSDPRVENVSFDIRDGNNENVKELLKEVGVDELDGYQRTSLLWASEANLDNLNNHEMTPRLLTQSMAGFDYNLPTTK